MLLITLRKIMKKLLSVVALSLAMVAQAQQQTTLKLEGKSYVITDYQRPSGQHMVMLSGPEGNAMISVQNDQILAYINPPGGGAYKTLIDKVWAAYLAKKTVATLLVVLARHRHPVGRHLE